MNTKYNIGDKVLYFGTIGTVSEIKMAGYLIDFEKSKNNFVYESDLTPVPDHMLEDDRGRNRKA